LIVACGDNRQQPQSQQQMPQAESGQAMPEEMEEPAKEAGADTTFEDVQAEAQDLTETIADYTADQRQEFAHEVDQALGAIDKRIETVEMAAKRDWDNLSDAARQNTQAVLQDLRNKREAVATSYQRIENDTDAAWDELKKGFSRAWTDVVAAVDKAEEEFEKDG
jgi:hypothetical protein